MVRKNKGIMKTKAGRQSKAGEKIFNKVQDKRQGRTKKKK